LPIIAEFARLIADVVGYKGAIVFDTARPDGTPSKLLDVTRLAAIGWKARIALREGLTQAYADYVRRQAR
jgi:GDP-L-fucose synthase